MLHLRCCTQASSRCGEQRLLLAAVLGLLVTGGFLVVECRL